MTSRWPRACPSPRVWRALATLFGGALVSRTFYARGQTGQQLLLAAYGALAKRRGGRRDVLSGARCSISSW